MHEKGVDMLLLRRKALSLSAYIGKCSENFSNEVQINEICIYEICNIRYGFLILQYFASKLSNVIKFNMLFVALVIDKVLFDKIKI